MAAAQTAPVEEAEPEMESSPATHEAAVLEDLAAVAEEENISLDQAIANYAWHEPFAQLVNQIRSAFPEAYSDSRINGDSAWIGFTADVPAAALEWVNDFERPIEVRTDRQYTESELDNRLIAGHHAVFDSRDIVAEASSVYDVENGEITIEVELAAGVTDEAAALDQLE